MSGDTPLYEGQVLGGPLFSEPMRVEAVRANGAGVWELGRLGRNPDGTLPQGHARDRIAAREKSIRHGHPSTPHLWWARRPLASSRAVLMALLLPDPFDPHCPEAFRREARRSLPKFIADFAHHPSGLPAAEEDGVRRGSPPRGTTGRSAP